jgi:hypothetical protein
MREREGMGPVNLLAESEAAEAEMRITGLQRERTDLTEAIARLRRGIATLDHEVRQRLIAAFGRINGHFTELFTRLFGGGKAHLALVDDEDPLAAGLEIMASPPGKRMQSLSPSIGREQALTALALLFAAFLTKPAVCVLDEVDARSTAQCRPVLQPRRRDRRHRRHPFSGGHASPHHDGAGRPAVRSDDGRTRRLAARLGRPCPRRPVAANRLTRPGSLLPRRRSGRARGMSACLLAGSEAAAARSCSE